MDSEEVIRREGHTKVGGKIWVVLPLVKSVYLPHLREYLKKISLSFRL